MSTESQKSGRETVKNHEIFHIFVKIKLWNKEGFGISSVFRSLVQVLPQNIKKKKKKKATIWTILGSISHSAVSSSLQPGGL